MAMLMMAYIGFQMMPFTRMQTASRAAITTSPRTRPRRGFFSFFAAISAITRTRITAPMPIR